MGSKLGVGGGEVEEKGKQINKNKAKYAQCTTHQQFSQSMLPQDC